MNEKIINVTLPAFAFVESSGHDGDVLKGRNVIIHIRSASIIEIFEEGMFFPKDDVITFRFKNTNTLGIEEFYIAALHYTATMDSTIDKKEIINRVIIPAAKWFCDYCDWEDKNVLK